MVRQTVEEIQRRLDDPPGFRELATRAFISPYHFHRIFRAMVGESPRELVRRLRLERAAHQLRRTPDPVVDIAFAAGYVTHEAFTKAFQAEFGASPSAFRAGGGECLGIRSRCGVHYMGSGFTAFHCRRTRHPPGRRTARSRLTDTKSPGGRTADLSVAVREGPDLGNEVAEVVHTPATSENKSWPKRRRRSWRYSPRTT